jgi:hypothetical protein
VPPAIRHCVIAQAAAGLALEPFAWFDALLHDVIFTLAVGAKFVDGAIAITVEANVACTALLTPRELHV